MCYDTPSGCCVSIPLLNSVPAVVFRFRSEYTICQAVAVFRFLPNIFLVVVFRFRFEWVSGGCASIPFPKCKSGGWVSISFPDIFLFPVAVDPFSEYILYVQRFCCVSIPFPKCFSGGCVSIPCSKIFLVVVLPFRF